MKIRNLILHENESLIAVNKPAGWLSIPDRKGKEVSLKTLLQENYIKIFTVHRLDRDTSGVIIFAKTEATHKHFSQQFESRSTIKIYNGLVIGCPTCKEGQIDAPIAENMAKRGQMLAHQRGKPALTKYKVLENFGKYSWVQFHIHTGRTHQIRVHCRELGHPLVADPFYGDGKPLLLSSLKSKFKLSKNMEAERPLLNRLALHASHLEICNLQNEWLSFTAPLPKELKVAVQQLDKWRQ